MNVATNQFKPHQLVRVIEPEYRYIGQVMSREMPYGTYMVRRVPGHSGTLMNLSTFNIREAEHNLYRTVKVSYASIDGRGSFPVDMLRYEHASPVNFTLQERERGSGLVAVIDPSIVPDTPELAGQLIIAKVDTLGMKSDWTTARWSSFMWGIRPLNTVRLTRASGFESGE